MPSPSPPSLSPPTPSPPTPPSLPMAAVTTVTTVTTPSQSGKGKAKAYPQQCEGQGGAGTSTHTECGTRLRNGRGGQTNGGGGSTETVEQEEGRKIDDQLEKEEEEAEKAAAGRRRRRTIPRIALPARMPATGAAEHVRWSARSICRADAQRGRRRPPHHPKRFQTNASSTRWSSWSTSMEENGRLLAATRPNATLVPQRVRSQVCRVRPI